MEMPPGTEQGGQGRRCGGDENGGDGLSAGTIGWIALGTATMMGVGY